MGAPREVEAARGVLSVCLRWLKTAAVTAALNSYPAATNLVQSVCAFSIHPE